MYANSERRKLLHFYLSFWIWKVRKGREKLKKFKYRNEKSFLKEMKNNFL